MKRVAAALAAIGALSFGVGVSAAQGVLERLLDTPEPMLPRQVSVSPDGLRLIYVTQRRSSPGEAIGLIALNVRRHEQINLTSPIDLGFTEGGFAESVG